jgi:hypothetical protein
VPIDTGEPMNRHLSKIINLIAPARTRSAELHQAQLILFPDLYSTPPFTEQTNRPIRLPKSVLVVNKDEQLNEYLSRVAAAAMVAATRICGTPAKAALRLGTSDHSLDREHQRHHEHQFPALRLISSNSQQSVNSTRASTHLTV